MMARAQQLILLYSAQVHFVELSTPAWLQESSYDMQAYWLSRVAIYMLISTSVHKHWLIIRGCPAANASAVADAGVPKTLLLQ